MGDYVGIIFDLRKRRESVSLCALKIQKVHRYFVAEVTMATAHMGLKCNLYVNNKIM